MRIAPALLLAAVLALPFGRAVQAQEGGVLTGTEGQHAAFFVQQAGRSDMFEIEAARIALRRTQSPEIRAFAEMMVADHTRSQEQITKAVKDHDLSTPLPKRIDLKHQQILDQLQRAADADFDRLYLNGQVTAHQEALKVYQHYAPTAEEPSLRAVAEAGLPMIQRHLDRARALQKGLQAAR
ncbi:DUF4142 domain-containing protein [Inquilinus limosus]|uniref:DUF4142 domain-containing protein n=1 Tax=Inquilinus limosus TaxID=171674 RepID=UPI003F1366F0